MMMEMRISSGEWRNLKMVAALKRIGKYLVGIFSQ